MTKQQRLLPSPKSGPGKKAWHWFTSMPGSYLRQSFHYPLGRLSKDQVLCPRRVWMPFNLSLVSSQSPRGITSDAVKLCRNSSANMIMSGGVSFRLEIGF